MVLSGVDLALVIGFRLTTGSGDLDFMIWNLALAWVPLVAALALDDVRSTPLLLQLPLLGLWLVFFPNAPYLVTDIVHIDPSQHSPAGILGGVAIAAAAPAGLALGASVVSLVAASVGIYLGRVVGLNSWDVLARPRDVAAALHANALDPHPLAAAGTVALAVVLATLYLRFRSVAAVEQHAR